MQQCLKVDALGHEVIMHASSHGLIHFGVPTGKVCTICRSRSIQRIMHKLGRIAGTGKETSNRSYDPAFSTAIGDHAPSCFDFYDEKGSYIVKRRGQNMCWYRIQLEQEVKGLQKQLQQELDLHVALANALDHNLDSFVSNTPKLPDETQELLCNISELELRVSKLEEELHSLNLLLCHERNEHHAAVNDWAYTSPPTPPMTSSNFNWEEHISSLRVSRFAVNHNASTAIQDLSAGSHDSESQSVVSFPDRFQEDELSESSSKSEEGRETNASIELPNPPEFGKSVQEKNLWQYPNELSEEMVRCMRDIFLCLSESSIISSKDLLDSKPFRSSPVGHLSSSSFTSYSDSSMMPSLRSNSTGIHQSDGILDNVMSSDPFGVNDNVNWGSIGSYGLATEVSWMSVGKEQLEYAAEALKRFKFLVEQLGRVNPAEMSGDEKLAFWINIYNALIMHAYLAYGIPKSDIKLFSLMQKASYKIGEQSFNAAEIEFVILKMRPPAHRPQLALVLALHKFRDSEEHRKYSIDSPQPLAIFALSCGMYSSPAIRIYSADNVHNELQNSMKDYIRAAIGINEKGKLLVPKLLHFFAKGVVEDSLLVDWICRYLFPDQVTIVRDSTSQRKQRLLGVRSFSVIPFDTRFRYLFLPDGESTS